MTNENQKRQKEEESKQKRLLKESRQKAKEAEKENKIRQKAEENAKRLAEKNSTDLPHATASEKAPDKERAADVKPADDESTRGQVESDTRSPESSDEEQKKKPVHKNYHVSLRDDGKWQVKFAKGEKALKLFDTQAEAITFAKEKAKNQDGNITIHKTDGKIRKQNYSKRD